MALIHCRECGKAISSEATSCPHCGAPIPKPKRTKWWLWVPLSLVAAFFAIGIIAGNSPEAEERHRQRLAIEHCWKEQSRKSFSADTSQFVAGACEMLEDRYRQKWGRNP